MAEPAAQRRYGDTGLDPSDPYYYRASTSLLAQEPANLNAPSSPAPSWLGWPALYRHLEARNAAEKTWRLPWWRTCGEIARFELPRRYHYFVTENDYSRGLRKDGAILNDTATLDGQTCAGGIGAVCTDPDSEWLKLGPGIPNLDLDRAGLFFYDDLTERLRYVQDRTNFYESLNQYYEDLTFFGTGLVIDYEDAENLFVCNNPCAGEYCLTSAANGDTGSTYIEERRTVEQIVTMFGLMNCPGGIRAEWAQKGGSLDRGYIVGHAIEPNFAIRGDRDGEEAGRLPGGFTWREVYWVIGKADKQPLSIAGFHEKPFAASQWHRVSNDPYGRGPGWTALGDVIELQIKAARQAELVEKIVRPPMSAPVALKNEPHSIKPDQTTYYDASTGALKYEPVFTPNPQAVAAIDASITKSEERIHRTFHADLFRMIEEVSLNTKRDVSATEVDALKEERLMQMGPVIGRVYRYGLRPRIERQLAILKRRGAWPKIPPSLQNVPLQIDFVSMLTQARRAGSVSSIERTFGFAANIAGLYPNAKDNLDQDEAVREVASFRSAPSKIVRAPAQVRQLRQQQQQAAQIAAQAQAAQAAVAGAKTMSETDLGGNSALSALTGGTGAA